jgi:23S rRNA (uracil1939-C5)-methyltransferase
LSRRKKQSYENLEITAYAAEGKSIGKLEDGKVLFVENAIPGDIVNVRVVKDKKSWAEAKITALVAPSPNRIPAFCSHFGVCGGCKWQMLPYPLQIQYKQQQVIDQLTRIGQLTLPPVLPILGSPIQTYYRNKIEFTFSKHRYRTTEELKLADDTPFELEPAMGFHAPGLFDKVVPLDQCYLQAEPTNTLLTALKNYCKEHQLEFYDFKAQAGWLRNIIIRVTRTNELLVNVIFKHDQEEARIKLLDFIIETVPSITSLHYTINPKVNDTIYDIHVITYYGKGFIEETLERFKFKISPKSFFQTNTYQAENLYSVVRAFANLSGTETVYDLYCGTGSIGIFLSDKAKNIVGIEAVEDAILDAKENAAWNELSNCHFYTGDTAKIINEAFFETNGFPDVIITDPPRAGMHPALIDQLLQIKSPKIVYVSCNPATQARDLQSLTTLYKIEKVQPVDMFPHTHHIENVVLLSLIA